MKTLSKSLQVFFLFLIFVSSSRLQAQSGESLEKQFWSMANFNWKLGERWVFSQDIAYQHAFTNPQLNRIMLRPWGNYQVSGIFSIQAGVIFFYNFLEAEANTYEVRPWVGAKLRGPSFWRLDFVNNLRIEERFEYSDGTSEWVNALRIRYKISTNIPINHFSMTDRTYYGILAYEFYGVPFDKEVSFTGEAVHRFDLGFGYFRDPKRRYEAVLVAFDSPNEDATGYSVKNMALFFKYKRYFNWE